MIPTVPPTVPTLYHVPWFCSSIPYNLALELSLPPTKLAVNTVTEDFIRKDPTVPAFSHRRVAPFMTLPNGQVIVEAGAILLYLCEQFDTQRELHPAPESPDRARFLQAVFYAVSECYRATVNVFALCFGRDPGARDRAKLTEAKQKYDEIVVEHLMRELGAGDRLYYLGSKFSAADISFAYILMCAEFCNEGLLENEVVRAYHERLKARATYKKLYSSTYSS